MPQPNVNCSLPLTRFEAYVAQLKPIPPGKPNIATGNPFMKLKNKKKPAPMPAPNGAGLSPMKGC